jgi:hypothetical protein
VHPQDAELAERARQVAGELAAVEPAVDVRAQLLVGKAADPRALGQLRLAEQGVEVEQVHDSARHHAGDGGVGEVDERAAEQRLQA